MAVNQKLENTSKSCNRSSHGAITGWSAMYCATLDSLRLRCGSSAPGTAARASRNSNTSAVPMEVSARHARRGNAVRDAVRDAVRVLTVLVVKWAASRR